MFKKSCSKNRVQNSLTGPRKLLHTLLYPFKLLSALFDCLVLPNNPSSSTLHTSTWFYLMFSHFPTKNRVQKIVFRKSCSENRVQNSLTDPRKLLYALLYPFKLLSTLFDCLVLPNNPSLSALHTSTWFYLMFSHFSTKNRVQKIVFKIALPTLVSSCTLFYIL